MEGVEDQESDTFSQAAQKVDEAEGRNVSEQP